MIELHNKQAIWEVTVTGTTSTDKENIEGTYFQAIKLSAIQNKDKTIDLTTAKALLKKYTTAFKENRKNTAKSKALSEKITELKSLNQDEILVQLTANTYQTLEQFYTSTLFKSLAATVKELNQVTLLNQIKSELSAKSASALTKDDVKELILADRKHRKSESTGISAIKALCFVVLAIAGIYQACIVHYSVTVGYLNENPIAQEKDYKLCMAEKVDVGNCLQYTKIIEMNRLSPLGNTRVSDAETIVSKNSLLSLATKDFNPKIYKDIETCSAKNLPDYRDFFERLIGVPTLLTVCQSNEISMIKNSFKKEINKVVDNQVFEFLDGELKKGGEEASKIALLFLITSFGGLLLYMMIKSNEENEKSKK